MRFTVSFTMTAVDSIPFIPMRSTNPLADPSPQQVPLAKAPLIRVLAVVRFPMIAEIEQSEFAAAFQKSVRTVYPVAAQETVELHADRPGVQVPVATKIVWRFMDEEGWRASLTRDFIALETKRYESRADFSRRLRHLLEALTKQVTPARVDRLGVRYIDRIEGQDLDDIKTLIHPELAGVADTTFMRQCKYSLADSLFDLGEAQLAGRWGLLPENATSDPSAIEPIPRPSWILDLDMSTTKHTSFSAESICAATEDFAARIYAFFRWAVTDEFLRRFGGAA